MGNICKGQDIGADSHRKSSSRNGSGSTSNFSPNEGYPLPDNPTVAGTSAVQRQEARADVSLSGQENGSGVNRAAAAVSSAHVDGSRTVDRTNHSANGVDAMVNHSQRDSAGSGEGDSGGDQSEKSERKESRHRDRDSRKDGERSPRRSDKDHHRSRSSKKRGSSKSRKDSRRRDNERYSEGESTGRRPRSERSEQEIAERKKKREREKRDRANGEPESEEARRQRREEKKKERRKRKEAEAARAAATGRTDADSNRESTVGIAGAHGSPDRTRESRSNRKETEHITEARKNSSREGRDGTAPRERGSGSHGASGVMAGSGASATGGSIAAGDVDRKKKGSSFRKVWL